MDVTMHTCANCDEFLQNDRLPASRVNDDVYLLLLHMPFIRRCVCLPTT